VGLHNVVEDSSERHQQNKTFLHDIATPMSILGLVIKRMINSYPENATEDEKATFAEIAKKAQAALLKMQEIHAEFKVVLSKRESDDLDK